MRINRASKNQSFSADIDGLQDIEVERLLSIPLTSPDGNRVLGVFHLINKSKTFTETDEIFVLIFANIIGPLMSSTIICNRLQQRSELSHSLLNASLSIYSILPSPTSALPSSRPVRIEDILNNLEIVVRNTLKCSKCRAYLLSDAVGEISGSLLSLELSKDGVDDKLIADSAVTRQTPISSGIAGYVVSSKSFYVLASDSDSDGRFNPEVDIEPLGWPLIAAPLTDLNGNIIACIEFVGSAFSPPMRSERESGDGRLSFLEAVQWLCYQLSLPLCHIISSVKTPAFRPLLSPRKLSPRSNRVFKIPAINKSALDEEALTEASDFKKLPSPLALSLLRNGSLPKDPTLGVNIAEYQETRLKLDHALYEIETLKKLACDSSDSMLILSNELEKSNINLKQTQDSTEFLRETIAKNTESSEAEKAELNISLERLQSELQNKEDSLALLLQTIEEERIDAQRHLETERETFKSKISEISLSNENEIAVIRAQAVSDSRAMSLQIKDLTSSLENANALFASRMNEIIEDSDKGGAATAALSIELTSSKKAFSELTFYKDDLEKRLREAEAALVQKESVIKIMQDQLVMMANESMQGLDDAIKSKQIELRPGTGPWSQLEDADGNSYFYNKETGESTWDPPPGYAVSVDGKLRPLVG